MTKELIYVADPMCSWCWGFAPVARATVERFADLAPMRVMVGGLRIGADKPLDGTMKAEIRSHWDHVHEATGQPFDFAFFERDGFVYDTEPACRAVVTARRIEPGCALAFLDRLQRAFYAECEDVTQGATLQRLAVDFGFDGDVYAEQFANDDTLAETRRDFVTTRRAGISGYPTLVGSEGARAVGLSIGYQPWDAVERVIAYWLDQPETPSAEAAAP